MRTIFCFICMLTTLGSFTAYGQESPSDAKEMAKATIAKAKVATSTVKKNYQAFRSLSKQQEDGIKPLSAEDKEMLAQFLLEQRAFLDLNRQVVDLIKVGESIFSYPGLLALSEPKFSERDNKYSVRLVVAYKTFEDDMAKHPTYRIVEFDEGGRITEVREFATVNMITE